MGWKTRQVRVCAGGKDSEGNKASCTDHLAVLGLIASLKIVFSCFFFLKYGLWLPSFFNSKMLALLGKFQTGRGTTYLVQKYRAVLSFRK